MLFPSPCIWSAPWGSWTLCCTCAGARRLGLPRWTGPASACPPAPPPRSRCSPPAAPGTEFVIKQENQNLLTSFLFSVALKNLLTWFTFDGIFLLRQRKHLVRVLAFTFHCCQLSLSSGRRAEERKEGQKVFFYNNRLSNVKHLLTIVDPGKYLAHEQSHAVAPLNFIMGTVLSR